MVSGPVDAVAVIGYAGRFPGAPDVDRFWTHLRAGTDVRTSFTDADLDAAGVPVKVRVHPRFVRCGYVVDGPTEFDADFFGLSPAEAALVDPQQRLFLECAWQVFEHAGHRPGGPVGVFAGMSLSPHLLDVLAAHRDAVDVVGSYQALTANDKDFLATRVSYKLGLTGPSVVVQTACSTSLVAVHLATQSLLAGECDLAVAGGVSVLSPQGSGYVHQPGMILSPDGRCRPFDAGATGTVRGNGLGAVLLRRLDEALADGDTVHAVVLGTAVNNDGSDKLGFSATSVARQRDLVVQAHELAGVDAGSVDYVETHGTGTDLGDPAEVAALAGAFRRATADWECSLGSVKGNVGHLDAAAGITGLIKVLLMLRHREIPPVLHHDRPNPKIDLADGRFRIDTRLRPWDGVDGIRRAGVTSLGIGGTNAHVIVEQPPEPTPSTGARPAQMLVLSARTPEALAAAADRLSAHLGQSDGADLADAAYTLQVGRVRFGYRRFVRCRSRGEAVRLLGAADPVHDETRNRPVVFLFPGQGTQRIGMGRLVHEREPVFRAAVDEVAELFRPHLGADLREVLYARPGAAAEERLREPEFAQAALFTTEYALATLLGGWGVRPTAMFGHSLGELVAACLAGVFTVAAATRLVARRGILMRMMPPGEMLAVSLSPDQAGGYLDGSGVDLAAVNSAQDCVFAGPPEAIGTLRDRLDRDGVDHRTLRTARAFHSASTTSILDEFAGYVQDASPRPPGVPFLSNLTGTWITAAQAVDPGYWADQLRRTVRCADGLATLLTDPGTAIVEVGPGQALAALVRRSPLLSGRPVVSTLEGLPRTAGDEHEAVLEALGRLWVAGVDIDWPAFHAGHGRRRVPLPGYPFQRRVHALDRPAPAAEPRSTAEWLYAPSWRRAVVPDPGRPGRRWLVVDSGDPLAERLAAGLDRAGQRVEQVAPRAGGYPAVLRDLRAADRWPDAVVRFDSADRPLDLSTVTPADAAPGELWFVTKGACRVESADRIDPDRAPLLGLAAVLPHEIDGVSCRVLDVGPDADVDRMVDELVGAGDRHPVVCHRGPFRWVPGFEPVRPIGTGVRPGRAYLVTGGLGRLGRRMVGWLTDRFDARVALVARPGDRDPGPLPGDPGRVAVFRADVADENGLRAAVDAAAGQFGRIDGVIHAAGLGGVRARTPLAAMTRDTVAAHFAPKVHGTAALARVLDAMPDPPDFCLLMSSNVSLLGGPEFGAYAAANAYLNAFATARAGTGRTRWISASWDAWADDGPGAPVLGGHAVGTADALVVLDRLVAWAPGGHVVVSARDFGARYAGSVSFRSAAPEAGGPTVAGGPAPAAMAGAPTVSTPVADLEALVHAVWQEVLGVSEVDPDGNFFDAGGDSMTGLRVIRKLSDRVGVELSAVDVYEAPTVRALAALLAARVGGGPTTPAVATEPADTAPGVDRTAAIEAAVAPGDEDQRARMREAALRRTRGTIAGVDDHE